MIAPTDGVRIRRYVIWGDQGCLTRNYYHLISIGILGFGRAKMFHGWVLNDFYGLHLRLVDSPHYIIL